MQRGPGTLYRRFLTLRYLVTRDRAAVVRFLSGRRRLRRLRVLARLLHITNHVRGYHTLTEMLEVADAILERGEKAPPLVVECGVGFGSSTAKLSVATAAVGGRLLAFDSFRGIPANGEVHRHLDGRRVVFRPGAFRGRLRTVRRTLARWGAPSVVDLRKGWFEDTLPVLGADRPDVVILDVDLLSSTRTCIRHLYPLLAPGGVLFTQDGHLQAIAELLGDPEFWRAEVGVDPPAVPGLGRDKLLAVSAQPNPHLGGRDRQHGVVERHVREATDWAGACQNVVMRQHREPGTDPSRIRSWRSRGVLILAALALAALLAPAHPVEAPPAPTGSRPFAWHRDELWEGLEASFREARAAGCEAIRPEALRLGADLDAALDELAADGAAPGDASLARVQSLTFALAPLAAACPQLSPAYAARAGRLRTEVKRASRSWDMGSQAARVALYQLLYGSRAALEEVLLQQAPAAVPALLRGVDEPSATPAAELLGVTVHSGDLLVSRGGAPTSALIARGNDYPGNFSHVALLWVDPDTRAPAVVEAHIERGVVVSTVPEYLADTKLRVMVLRLRADLPVLARDPMLPHRVATAALERTRAGHIPYDFAMDFEDHSRQFCSEVASAAYASAGVRLWMGLSTLSSPGLRRWLAGFGVRHFVTEEPSDLEYDPQLVVVAEWRDPETLYRDHLDNAVTEVMLEGAERGEELGCPWRLLPLARAAKAWSVLCNLTGRPGPVPEGMSSEAALRNRSYSARHRAIGERLRALADAFTVERGYRPPYWQLVRLARTAAAEQH